MGFLHGITVTGWKGEGPEAVTNRRSRRHLNGR